MLATDKNIGYQQNLTGRKIAILVLGTRDGVLCGYTLLELPRPWTKRLRAAIA